MVYCLELLLAGVLQGIMVSLNGQLGNYYSMFGICFFVHGIAMLMLLVYLLAIRRERLNLPVRRGMCIWLARWALQLSPPAAGAHCKSARQPCWRCPQRDS